MLDFNIYFQSLRLAECRADDLRAANSNLEAQVELLTSELASLQVENRSRKRRGVAEELTSIDIANMLGKKWSIMKALWLDPMPFELEPGELDPNPLARLANGDNYDCFIAHELRAFIPSRFHDEILTNAKFRKAVSLYFAYGFEKHTDINV